MNTLSPIFADFLHYCDEDNKKLTKDIKIWLADYFDLKNRTISITKEEDDWIRANLDISLQKEIFGISLDDWIKMREGD